jgi:hypothetical protein
LSCFWLKKLQIQLFILILNARDVAQQARIGSMSIDFLCLWISRAPAKFINNEKEVASLLALSWGVKTLGYLEIIGKRDQKVTLFRQWTTFGPIWHKFINLFFKQTNDHNKLKCHHQKCFLGKDYKLQCRYLTAGIVRIPTILRQFFPKFRRNSYDLPEFR